VLAKQSQSAQIGSTTIKTFAMGTRSRFDGKAGRLAFTDPFNLLDQRFPSSQVLRNGSQSIALNMRDIVTLSVHVAQYHICTACTGYLRGHAVPQ
jgi:hypothetical protein